MHSGYTLQSPMTLLVYTNGSLKKEFELGLKLQEYSVTIPKEYITDNWNLTLQIPSNYFYYRYFKYVLDCNFDYGYYGYSEGEEDTSVMGMSFYIDPSDCQSIIEVSLAYHPEFICVEEMSLISSGQTIPCSQYFTLSDTSSTNRFRFYFLVEPGDKYNPDMYGTIKPDLGWFASNPILMDGTKREVFRTKSLNTSQVFGLCYVQYISGSYKMWDTNMGMLTISLLGFKRN